MYKLYTVSQLNITITVFIWLMRKSIHLKIMQHVICKVTSNLSYQINVVEGQRNRKWTHSGQRLAESRLDTDQIDCHCPLVETLTCVYQFHMFRFEDLKLIWWTKAKRQNHNNNIYLFQHLFHKLNIWNKHWQKTINIFFYWGIFSRQEVKIFLSAECVSHGNMSHFLLTEINQHVWGHRSVRQTETEEWLRPNQWIQQRNTSQGQLH